MKRVTIYDVAKEANVSLATVSRVINGVDVVREDTRQRVEDAINALGYKPNAIAQGLALQKTTTIGVVIPEANFSFTGNMINGLLDVSRIYKYNIMLHTTTEGIADLKDVIEIIIKSRVDGVIIYSDQVDQETLDYLHSFNIPVVLLNKKWSGDLISSVYVDFEKAVYQIVDQYLADNKKEIAIIEDRKNNYAMNQMLSGINKAFKKHNLVFDNYLKIPDNYHTSYTYLLDVLKDKKYDLILAFRDSQALASINAALENGYKVPDDIEVICMVDSKYNSMMRPMVSAFFVPAYDLGALSMRVITKMLRSDKELDSLEQEIELKYFFNKRNSTK